MKQFHSEPQKLQDEESQALEKPLWLEVISTIAIPLAIGFLTLGLGAVQVYIAQKNRSNDITIANANRRQDLDIANKNRQHEIMSEYLKNMKELIVDEQLFEGSSEQYKQMASMARAMTLNVARQIETPEGKGQLLKFLYEADLIGRCQLSQEAKPIQCEEPVFSLTGVKLDALTLDNPMIPLARINLEGAKLGQANMPGVTLIMAEMNQATLKGAILSGSDLSDSKMENVILENADLTGARLSRAKLGGASLSNAVFNKAKLQEADLRSANLTGTKLQEADLRNANLSGANLQGADLTGAILTGAILKDAKYDSKTKLPEFNPNAAGMRELNFEPAAKRQTSDNNSQV